MFGKFIDMTVTLPAATEAEEGMVLGEITETHTLTPYKSNANDGSQVPCYILAQHLKNEETDSVDITAVRVLATGEISSNEVILANTSDKLADIVTALKNNSILVINAQKCVENIGE